MSSGADFDPSVDNCGNDREAIISLAVWEICIPAIGIPFNILAIFIIVSLKEYKHCISHWYVLQLAVADLIYLSSLPIAAHQHITRVWNFSEGFCKVYQGIFIMTYYAGILFLTVMSFDRYIAIVHHASWARKYRTHINAYIITAVVWIISLLFSIPLMVWSSVVNCSCSFNFNEKPDYEYEDFGSLYDDIDFYELFNSTLNEETDPEEHNEETSDKLSCAHSAPTFYQAWVYANFVFAYVLPVIVIMVCYGLMLQRVKQPVLSAAPKCVSGSTSSNADGHVSKKSEKFTVRNLSSSHRSKRISQQRKITTIVVTLVIVFLICWTPLQVLTVVRVRGLYITELACERLIDATSVLAYSNSLLNPILYTFLGECLGSKFRTRLREACNCFRKPFKSSSGGTRSSQRRKKAQGQNRTPSASQNSKTPGGAEISLNASYARVLDEHDSKRGQASIEIEEKGPLAMEVTNHESGEHTKTYDNEEMETLETDYI